MNSSAEKWLLDQCAEETSRALQSMSDARPASSCAPLPYGEPPPELGPGTVYLEVTLSLAAGGTIWIIVPAAAVEAMGNRALRAAGIEDASPEDIQNTCFEILQQAHAGLAQAISARVKRAVTSKGREVDVVPTSLSLNRLQIAYEDAPPIVLFLAVAPALLEALNPPPEPDAAVTPAIDDRVSPSGTSKTFEVLLDVSMPVSVSFGRTQMPIKEVLKLTTGSIVELNRALTEPVEVIINDRVIARGEVVVVDGNYGVRILHIVSRQERFQSTAYAAALISRTDLRQ
jgi:flagellar motor switch protein FliN/FliY